jgi:nucleotide-binding universal stress UspA family protein
LRVVLPPADFGKYAKQHSIAWEKAIYETEHAEAASYLVNTSLKYGNEIAGIDVGLVIATGIPAPAICAAARLERADLIIMRGRAERGFQRWLFGSVTQEVIRHSDIPVLVLHEQGPDLSALRASRPLRVLVPLSGSPASEIALEPALQFLAASSGQEAGILHLLRVIDLPVSESKMSSPDFTDTSPRANAIHEADSYLQDIAERLYREYAKADRLSITTSVKISPDIARTIAQQAECDGWESYAGGCDLIVVADRHHRGIERLLRRKVTRHVLSSTRIPVLVVRAREALTRSSSK